MTRPSAATAGPEARHPQVFAMSNAIRPLIQWTTYRRRLPEVAEGTIERKRLPHMNELFAGYTNYASTEAVLHEQLTANGTNAPDTSITVTVSASWSWSVTFTFTW